MTHLWPLLIVASLQLTIGIVSSNDKNATISQPTIPKSKELSPPSKAQSVLPPSVTKTLFQEKVCNSSPNFDATLFDFSIWNHYEAKTIRDSDASLYTEQYHFSLCHVLGFHNSSTIPTNCSDYHICHVINNGTNVQIHGYRTLDFIETPHNGLTFVVVKSDKNSSTCYVPETKSFQPSTIHLSFTCDRQHGLGRPIKKLSSPCSSQFIWPTVAACNQAKQELHPSTKNILSKCYTYDSNGDIRDLSPLIAEDGYDVLSMPEVNSTKVSKKYFINVCSEVGKSCGPIGQSGTGTAACSRIPGPPKYRDTVDHLGYVRKSSLHYDEVSDEVVLTYQASKPNLDRYKCTHQTHIRFKCPKRSSDVNVYGLESRKPFLLSTSDCETVIEWETDHSCPVHKLRGNMSTCSIEDDDFKIDLSPLQKMGQIVVKNITGEGFKPKVTYDVVLSVCGSFEAGKICPDNTWKSNSVCINATDGTNHLIGSKKSGASDPELAYNDGQITLVYPTNSHGNDLCTDKEASPVTTLNFICDPSTEANVTFVSMSPTCEFDFNVRTKHACHPDHLKVPSCSLEYEGTLFDLSPLRKKAHEYLWTASVNPWSFKSAYTLTKDERVLINVCGPIPKVIKNNGTCIDAPLNAAACVYNGKSHTSRNIGQFINPPIYDPAGKSINLTYETDDVKSKKVISAISFFCAPGILDSSPVLVDRTENTTTDAYYFEWKTSAACPLKTSIGTDCMVTDETLGYTFDLNPLKRENPYIVHWGKYDFHLSVCGKLFYNQCEDKNAGICQRDRKNNATYVSGQANGNLTYFDGVLKLTYFNGTKYRDADKTPRKAEIVFICDEENDVDMVDKPKLEHVAEGNQTYFFRWYTKHACPDFENIVPCSWTNGTHTIDLSPMSLEWSNHFEVGGIKRDTGPAHDKYYANVCRPLNPVRGIANCRKGSAICWQSIDRYGKETVISLGVPTSPPAFYNGLDFSIFYQNGDDCIDGKENKTWSSWINFVCDPDSDAHGQFKEIAQSSDQKCWKKFEWSTNLVCDVFPAVPHVHPVSSTVPPTMDKGSGTESKNSKPGAAGIVIMTVLSFLVVLFALFILINREARTIMVLKLRSLVCRDGNSASRSMYYSQLTTTDFNTSADQVAFISGHSSLSPYNSTTTSIYNGHHHGQHGSSTGSPYSPIVKNGGSDGSSNKNGSRIIDTSINVPFPNYDDDDIDLLS